MRKNKRNGQPNEGVCGTQHTVHSDELFVIRQHKRNGSQMKVCAIYNIRFTRMNCLCLGKTKEMVSQIKVCVIEGICFRRIKCLRLGNITETGQPDQSVCD